MIFFQKRMEKKKQSTANLYFAIFLAVCISLG